MATLKSPRVSVNLLSGADPALILDIHDPARKNVPIIIVYISVARQKWRFSPCPSISTVRKTEA